MSSLGIVCSFFVIKALGTVCINFSEGVAPIVCSTRCMSISIIYVSIHTKKKEEIKIDKSVSDFQVSNIITRCR